MSAKLRPLRAEEKSGDRGWLEVSSPSRIDEETGDIIIGGGSDGDGWVIPRAPDDYRTLILYGGGKECERCSVPGNNKFLSEDDEKYLLFTLDAEHRMRIFVEEVESTDRTQPFRPAGTWMKVVGGSI